jgi:hypothetical protein
MADNVAITAGSGTTIATDEVAVNGGSVAHAQYVKLVDGTANGTDGIPGTTQGLATIPRRDLQRIAVDSGGLTIATTAYTAGDQLGTQFTLANAARASGGTGTIVGVVVTSAADIIGAIDVVFTRSSITLAADNAAYAISDTDAKAVIGIVQCAGAFDIGNNRVAQAFNLAVPYDCSGGTSLYASLITRVGHTFFAAVTDLQLQVFVERN